MSLADMRKELRELRKNSDSHKPVSKLRKQDIDSQLEALRNMRETTPPVAATTGAEMKKMTPKAATVMKSKEKEHPVAPGKKMCAPGKMAAPKKGMSKKEMMAMLAELSSDEE
jgi:hypothetical protein